VAKYRVRCATEVVLRASVSGEHMFQAPRGQQIEVALFLPRRHGESEIEDGRLRIEHLDPTTLYLLSSILNLRP
jgi:hypothetical protein